MVFFTLCPSLFRPCLLIAAIVSIGLRKWDGVDWSATTALSCTRRVNALYLRPVMMRDVEERWFEVELDGVLKWLMDV